MKKTFVSLCMAAALGCLTSCGAGKGSTQISLAGEWNIIDVDGTALTAQEGEEDSPFIGFNVEEKQVYGYSGCNRLMGTFNSDAKEGTLDLGELASTRMMCPDMAIEDKILATLGKVKKFKSKDGLLQLCNSTDQPVMTLQKREAE